MKNKCNLALVGWILLAIGGLNWGLVGISYFVERNLNLVNLLFGKIPTLEATVYIVVGLAAIASFLHCKCKKCQNCSCSDSNCNHCKVQ
ncbi:MAG: DUF378 domain-containing protein [Candidatus Vogelbacteria bacterium]|nr:DUF378 domain-containing protein [Candidatus Vogelbacteria bacterium]